MPEERVVVKVQDIRKTFRVGTQNVEVLKGIKFDIYEKDFLVIFGPSGCGKSTLLNTILGLEIPTAGSLVMLDTDLYKGTNEDDRSRFRKRNIGMVYQQANWIKALNVQENVAFPLTLLGKKKSVALTKALEILEQVGMAGWAKYMPLELSSGQQQRVSLARSLINDPKIIVADEPTGNLDFKSGQQMMNLLSQLTKLSKTVIMVTHDLEYLKYSNRIVKMIDGTLEGVYTGADKDKVLKTVSFKRGDVNTEEDADDDKQKKFKNTKKKDDPRPETGDIQVLDVEKLGEKLKIGKEGSGE